MTLGSVEIIIPLVGLIQVDKSQLEMIGMVVGKSLLTKDIPVDEETWSFLIQKKYAGRYRTVNDFIRVEMMGKEPLRLPVKTYSDEGDSDAIRA